MVHKCQYMGGTQLLLYQVIMAAVATHNILTVSSWNLNNAGVMMGRENLITESDTLVQLWRKNTYWS